MDIERPGKKRVDREEGRLGCLCDSMREEETDTLAVVGTTASLSKSGTNIDRLDTIASLLLLSVGDGVGDDETAETATVQVLNGLTRENTVDDDGVNFLCAVLHNGISSFDKSTAGISHIIDNNGNFVLDVSDENHAGNLIGPGTFLVYQSELQIETVGDTSSSEKN